VYARHIWDEDSRLSALSPGNPDLSIKIAALSFFLLPTTSQNTAISHLKQCLHFDPDSKPCKKAHKAFKALQKGLSLFFSSLSFPALSSRLIQSS
jgi:DnaJ family protein C protein 3